MYVLLFPLLAGVSPCFVLPILSANEIEGLEWCLKGLRGTASISLFMKIPVMKAGLSDVFTEQR